MSAIKDFDWISSHYSELQRTYPNMYIAVRDGKVITANADFGKVFGEAKRKFGKDFVTGYILSGEPFVLEADL